MAPQDPTTTFSPAACDPLGYQILDLIVDLVPRRVIREGAVVPLKPLTFDLLVALASVAPSLLSFDQLNELVWPGLVVSPETIVQRVKLLRDALGDDSQAPRYIEGVRGRGYRIAAEVRPLTERRGASEAITLAAHQKANVENTPLEQLITAATEAAIVDARSALPPQFPPYRRLIWRVAIATAPIALLLASLGAFVHYRGASAPLVRTSVAGSGAIHSIAVLPLENLSGDKEQEYFASGMTDALTTDLAQVGSLRVISRTSANQFKDPKQTLPQIGRDLKVDAVVEGTVTRGANRMRVTAQLVQTSTDQHLWARTYERDLTDAIALQDEIAHDVAEQIRVTLTPKGRSLRIQVHPVDPEAYDDYLRGAYWMSKATEEGLNMACGYFQKAVAKDPSYAPIYVGVARCQESADKYKEFVLKALALDPSLADAHARLALVKLGHWDWLGAEAEFKQAISFNPNDAPAHSWYAFYLVAMARPEEAIREIERARDLDPYDAFITMQLGEVLYHARRYDDALRVNQRGLEMHPDATGFYWYLADIYEQKKMFAEAFNARQRSFTIGKEPHVAAYAAAYKRAGYTGYLLAQAEIEMSNNTAYAAHCYALAGDESRAIAALQATYKTREIGVLFIRTAPELDSLRSSSNFQDLIRRIGFPPSPLVVH